LSLNLRCAYLENMFNGIILFFVLFICWIVFSGFIEPFFIVSGLVSCGISLYFAHKMDIIDHKAFPIYIKPKLPLYFLWLFKEIVISSIDVAIRVWKVKPDISPVTFWIKARKKSDVGHAIYANSITLTPGTVCTNVEGGNMQVHALSEEGMDSLACGTMDRKVSEVVK